MKNYLLDTHALIFWFTKENVTDDFISFLDDLCELGKLFVSPISFWETAFLVKKNRIELDNVEKWCNRIFDSSNMQLLQPSFSEMIESVNLPDFHKDPFDRLLIAQAINNDLFLVTKDETIKEYNVEIFWI